MAGARFVCAFAGLVVATGAHAEPVLASFDALAHGEIITNQFADVGMSISAENFQLAGVSPIVFDSNMFGTSA